MVTMGTPALTWQPLVGGVITEGLTADLPTLGHGEKNSGIKGN